MYNILHVSGHSLCLEKGIMSEAELKKAHVNNLLEKIKQNPEDITNYREITNIYVSEGDYDSALSVYNKMLDVFPDDVQALIN